MIKKKLEARLRQEQIKKKTELMQAKTGATYLSSNYSRIHSKLKQAQNLYGEVRQYNLTKDYFEF